MIQIWGREKCFDTRKAERYFKERKIPYQRIDLEKKGLSKRELAVVLQNVTPQELLDEKSKRYASLYFGYVTRTEAEIVEYLLEFPDLLRSPIVRNGNEASVGYTPERWKNWKA